MRRLMFLLAGLTAALACLSSAAYAQDRVHYVRVIRQMFLRDRTPVPAGGEVAIKYDAGDNWIPYMVVYLPSLPKSSATLVEEISFTPPINGTVNNITAVYQRGQIPGAQIPGSIATAVTPSSTGRMFTKGETLSIGGREGDYYIVVSQSHLNSLIPVASVDISSQALGSGRVVPVPPMPAVPADTSGGGAPLIDTSFQDTRMATRQGQLFGQLKVAYTLAGKVLAPGNYVIIAYDDGNSWALGGMVWQNPPHIAKAAVDLVRRVDFVAPLTGRIKSPTTVYKLLPEVLAKPDTLEQSEIFANLNLSVRPGDQVYINAREGNDYLVELPAAGKRGRVPVSAVDVIAGDPKSGVQTTIPPLPQNTDPQASGYVAPPPTPGSPPAWLWYCVPIVVLSVVCAGGVMIYNRPRGELLDVPDFYLDEYKGFKVTKNDFKRRRGRGTIFYYRINPDGSAINLRRWHFHTETGEFLLVKSRHNGRVILSTKTFRERYTFFHQPPAIRIVLGVALLAVSLFVLKIATFLGFPGYRPNYTFAVNFVFQVPFALFFVWIAFAFVSLVIKPKALENWVVGPEELTPLLADGPRQPETKVKNRGGLDWQPTV